MRFIVGHAYAANRQLARELGCLRNGHTAAVRRFRSMAQMVRFVKRMLVIVIVCAVRAMIVIVSCRKCIQAGKI